MSHFASGNVSPQCHVVHDDLFSTAPNAAPGVGCNLDAFDAESWKTLCDSGLEQTLDHFDEETGRPIDLPELHDDWLTPTERQERNERRDKIQEAHCRRARCRRLNGRPLPQPPPAPPPPPEPDPQTARPVAASEGEADDNEADNIPLADASVVGDDDDNNSNNIADDNNNVDENEHDHSQEEEQDFPQLSMQPTDPSDDDDGECQTTQSGRCVPSRESVC